MQIRNASKKDVLQLSELFQQAVEFQGSRANHYELLRECNWIAYTEERLNISKGRITVAEHDGGLAGFIQVRIINYPPKSEHQSFLQRIRRQSKSGTYLPIKPMQWGIIEECYVMPSFRRQGIGSELVQSVMEWFKTKKITRIELSVVAGNPEGESFWRKSGFGTSRYLLSKTI